MFKKTLISFSLLLVMTAQADNFKEVSLDKVDKFTVERHEMLSNSTKIREQEDLYLEKAKIISILKTFEILKKQMVGFEERKFIVKFENIFKDKYILKDYSLFKVRQNLNEVINFTDKIEKDKMEEEKNKKEIFKPVNNDNFNIFKSHKR